MFIIVCTFRRLLHDLSEEDPRELNDRWAQNSDAGMKAADVAAKYRVSAENSRTDQTTI